MAALQTARTMPDKDLPAVAARYDGPPPPRTWADRDPVAAARLARARMELKQLAEDNRVPVENLMTPDYVRRLLWEPPDGDDLPAAVRARLLELGARTWQIDMTLDVFVDVISAPPPPPTELLPPIPPGDPLASQ